METSCRQHCSQGLKYTRIPEEEPVQLHHESSRTNLPPLAVPTLNYAAAAWDPYQARDINQLEQVQKRGAYLFTTTTGTDHQAWCHICSRILDGDHYRR
ncbi:hypothetical protein DPMN_160019 [Dreissena polymorpha]|uniref:Uncharacterized protein n=1 Tax=Dreissena polymorpha TaxID=45954 RepID=A0A9D4ELZ9_DREPO|nr:hypothetical protein DPMN_160019 [Dreissena polymorpha]